MLFIFGVAGMALAALGVITALAGSRLPGNVFFGVSATDAVSFARALAASSPG